MTTTLVFLGASLLFQTSISSSDIGQLRDAMLEQKKSCGALSIWYAARRLGYPLDADQLIKRADTGPKGISVQRLFDVSREAGLPSYLIELPPTRANLDAMPVPAILALKSGHAIAYDGIENGQARFFDPTNRSVMEFPADSVVKRWNGTAVVFVPPELSPVAGVSAAVLTAAGVAIPLIFLLRRRNR